MNKYEAKMRYVDSKNRANQQNSNLTQEQHEAIQLVCSMRHELHSNLEDLIISESSNFSRFSDWLISETESFKAILDRAGIQNDLQWNPEDLPDDDSIYAELGIYEDYEDFYYQAYEVASDIHNHIENTIRNIDSKYATSYAPTGLARLL
jgi:hypothetical protein